MVDLLAQNASVVARYSAGNNAGHTVVNSYGLFRLHLVPAGIFYPDKTCLIGNGLVIDPAVLVEEIEELKARGVSIDRLVISDRAHVIMPYHPMVDKLDEQMRGDARIGTTGRGVGPAFADKVARIGIRMADLVDPKAFHERLSFVLPYKNAVLEKLYGAKPLDFQEVYDTYSQYGSTLAPFVRDTAATVRDAIARGETVLLEGAQGGLLDLDGGTYDYVTSSVPSSLAAGAALGIGIGPTQITRVVAVYKAYNTRVGNGPMPTELTDKTGLELREKGAEYGATTGRPRRCGWFDAVAARYTARLNGLSGALVTRLDVLDTFPTIKICTAYEVDGGRIEEFPSNTRVVTRCKPVYEELPGWQQPTADIRRFEDLPEAARNYVKRLESFIGVPIEIVSVGPEREQAIVVKRVF